MMGVLLGVLLEEIFKSYRLTISNKPIGWKCHSLKKRRGKKRNSFPLILSNLSLFKVNIKRSTSFPKERLLVVKFVIDQSRLPVDPVCVSWFADGYGSSVTSRWGPPPWSWCRRTSPVGWHTCSTRSRAGCTLGSWWRCAACRPWRASAWCSTCSSAARSSSSGLREHSNSVGKRTTIS